MGDYLNEAPGLSIVSKRPWLKITVLCFEDNNFILKTTTLFLRHPLPEYCGQVKKHKKKNTQKNKKTASDISEIGKITNGNLKSSKLNPLSRDNADVLLTAAPCRPSTLSP